MDSIKDIRKQTTNFLKKLPTIDRLFTDQMEDFIIVKEPPIPVFVGGKTLFVANFTYDTEIKFFKKWAAIISALSARIVKMELTTKRRKDLLTKGDFFLLGKGIDMMEFLLMDSFLKRKLCKLLKETLFKQQGYILNTDKKRILKTWNNCSYKYFKKNVSKEDLIQICWLIFKYNFDQQKKSLQLIIEKMNIKSDMEMYIPFWLQNLDGLQGKFLNAQAPSIDYAFRDTMNEKKPKPEVKEKKNGK